VKESVEERKAALDRIRQLDAEYRRQQRAWFSRRHRRGNLVLNEQEEWANVYYNEQASERDETAVTLHRGRRRLIVAVENFLARFAKIPWVTGQRLVQRATSSDDLVARLHARLLQAQSEAMAPIDLISILVSDELACRSKRLLERRHKQAQFRDSNKLLDNFDFQFNPKMNRSLVFDPATAAWIGRREDALFLGPSGSGKSHCAQAIGHAVIQQGYRVLYREAHILLEELADATLDGNRKQHVELLTTVPLLIIDDLGMRKLPLTAAEELLEIIMRRYERASTLITSNRPVEDWGKLLGDSAAVSAMLDRLLHHGHVLKCGPRSWRTKTGSPGESQ
jgi:DNA replication protein DnaC